MLSPGGGQQIVGGGLQATVKMTMDYPALTSTFEMVIPPGWDVGAHVHSHGEEIFYVVEGELDVLAFEPLDRNISDWHQWTSKSGQTYLRGGPGAFMFVPEQVPHAFSNPTADTTKLFFQSSVPGGHENYFQELMRLLRDSAGRPAATDVDALRRRYDIEQLTTIVPGSPPQTQPETTAT